MTKRSLYYSFAIGVLFALLAGCTPDDAAEISQQHDAAVPADVIAALEAAARGEPFEDDIHPKTAKTDVANRARV